MNAAQKRLAGWLERVRANEDRIYVREQGATVALADLTPARWAHHVAYWLATGRTPVIYRGS